MRLTRSSLFPYTTLFRSVEVAAITSRSEADVRVSDMYSNLRDHYPKLAFSQPDPQSLGKCDAVRSEEHTSELQSRPHLVCRLLLEKKKTTFITLFLLHLP